MDRRSEVRVQKNLLVSISKKGFEGMGLTSDVSRSGMMLATTEILPDNGKVVLVVGIQDEVITLRGQVVWSRNSFHGLGEDVTCSCGVSLEDTPQEYLEFVEKFITGLL